MDQVLDQIKEDVKWGDMTSIRMLLTEVPEATLRSYLSIDDKYSYMEKYL
tara:strand:- start:1210 stop:1359 length:150 start_codon:yes stop_codon:yes gene_type:complete